ncbi:MAG TPA: hypothetical protein VN428_27345 [Bryobacteraceae bacterium]|nr:hypothetical protein [Bryobacteraceae bacterium]
MKVLTVLFVFGAVLLPAAPAQRQQRRSADIEPFQADTIEPYKPNKTEPKKVAPASEEAPAPKESAGKADAGAFYFRTFGLAVPGVVYSYDNIAAGTRTTVTAPGAVTKSAVRLQKDGSYIWNSSWDGKVIRGRWTPAAGGGITLLRAQEGKDWRMERLKEKSGKAEISLWDQSSIWYHGTPLAEK